MGDLTDKINAQLDDDQPASQVRVREPAPEPKITLEEITEMFGGSIPVEALSLLFGADGSKTVGEVRQAITDMAKGAACDFKVDLFTRRQNLVTLEIRGYQADRISSDELVCLLRGWPALRKSIDTFTGPGSAHPLGSRGGTYKNGKRIV